MGKYNLSQTRVLQKVTQHLKASGQSQRPPWYDVISEFPPSGILVRPAHRFGDASSTQGNRRARKRGFKPSRLFQPVDLVYPEDRLRKTFFNDHPWELARPKVLVENTGNDSKHWNWSRMEQLGKSLDGESVVQRQMWLMENEALSETEAYDKARKEFYKLRLEQDVERQVAKEEARYVGARFGRGPNEISMAFENEQWQNWRKWALEAVEAKKHEQMAMVSGNESIDTLLQGESKGTVQEETT